MLDEERKLQLLALSRIEDLKKSVNLKTLLSRFNNSPEEIFKQNASSLAAASGMSFVLAQKLIASFDLAMKHAGKQMEFAAKNNFSSVTFLDEDYPANLLECADFPPFLFYKGKNIKRPTISPRRLRIIQKSPKWPIPVTRLKAF